jgi:uncharacterized protein YjbK
MALFAEGVLPSGLRKKLGRAASGKLTKIGQIYTNRRFIAVNSVMLKADENLFEGGGAFYTIRIIANDLEKGREDIKAALQDIGVKFSFSESSKYVRLVGE